MKTFTEFKGTKGEWQESLFGLTGAISIVETTNGDELCRVFDICEDGTEFQANAKLIADAGTTANNCGLLPSELLEQRNELLEALQEMIKLVERIDVRSKYDPFPVQERAIEILNKAL